MTVYLYWSGPDFDFGNFLAVASAAVHTPDDVTLLVDEQPEHNPSFERLRSIPNVRIEPVLVDDLMSAEHAALYRRMRFVAHRSDLVSFCVLAQRGGIYLDTDTLTRRSLADLPDRLLFDDGKIIHVGAMSFPPGDPLPAAMMADFLLMPEADFDVYQSIVYRWTRLVRSAAAPADYGVLSSFFPVHWKEWEGIFQPGGFDGDLDSIHVLHHYGYFSRKYTATMDEAWLAANPCLFSAIARPVLAELDTMLAPGMTERSREGTAGMSGRRLASCAREGAV
jgi:hypothetical protein